VLKQPVPDNLKKVNMLDEFVKDRKKDEKSPMKCLSTLFWRKRKLQFQRYQHPETLDRFLTKEEAVPTKIRVRVVVRKPLL